MKNCLGQGFEGEVAASTSEATRAGMSTSDQSLVIGKPPGEVPLRPLPSQYLELAAFPTEGLVARPTKLVLLRRLGSLATGSVVVMHMFFDSMPRGNFRHSRLPK